MRLIKICVTVMAVLGGPLGGGVATAAEFPQRPIKIITGFAPGTSTDVLARAFAKEMSEDLKQPVVVENMTGSNGVLASTNVARAQPDGYTLLFVTGSHVANAAIGKNIGYDPITDFSPVFMFAQSYGLALITSLPVSSVANLVDLAKSKRGQLTYATSGLGNITHVAGVLLQKYADISLIDVPYNSPTLATDVVGGQVDMAFISTVVAVPLVKSGRVKVLATTGDRRTPALQDTPTMQESGYKDFVLTGYFGFVAPAKLPGALSDTISGAMSRALNTATVQRVISDSGLYVAPLGPERFADFIATDFDHQKRLMQQLEMKAQ